MKDVVTGTTKKIGLMQLLVLVVVVFLDVVLVVVVLDVV
jgi:hypothetical protein